MQYDLESLKFAQKFPFSNTAKNIVKKENFTLENIDQIVWDRAKTMILSAYNNELYSPRICEDSTALKNEICAYPVAKILLSLIGKPETYSQFASMFSKTGDAFLKKKWDETYVENLSDDFKIKFNLYDVDPKTQKKIFEIDLLDYLKVDFSSEHLKLVNQKVVNGKIFVTENDLIDFLSGLAYEKILSSLPVEISNLPKAFKLKANELKRFLIPKKNYDFKITGKINPDYFAPCMSKIYGDLIEGKNVSHIARFDIATFMLSLGSEAKKVVELFKKTPNFNEKVTTYQVTRLIGEKGPKYSPPSCAKIKEQGLCVANCPVKHPSQYYENQMKKNKNKEKNKD